MDLRFVTKGLVGVRVMVDSGGGISRVLAEFHGDAPAIAGASCIIVSITLPSDRLTMGDRGRGSD